MATRTDEENLTITSAAGGLVDAIQASPRWRAWRDADRMLQQDADMPGLLARYNELSGRWQRSRRSGQNLPANDMVEMAQIRDKIMNHPLTRTREEAAGGMVRLLQEVDLMLSTGLGVNFAATVAPSSGGCCG